MDDHMTDGQALSAILLVLVSGLYVWIIFVPVEAATWGDNFNTNTSEFYNKSSVFRHPNGSIVSASQPAGSSFLPDYQKYIRFGNSTTYSFNYTGETPAPATGRLRGGFVYLAQSNFTGTDLSSSGNQYYLYIRQDTGTNSLAVNRIVAGALTAVSNTTFSYDPIQEYNKTYVVKISVSNGIHRVFINDIPVMISSSDLTFTSGYAGFLTSYTSLTRFDDLFINESASSKFSCTTTNPATCTQGGTNFNDPGTRSWWVWGDGTTSNAINGSHTYLPGTYTVSLLNENVAGSSSEVKRDYIKVADTSGQGLVINPSIRNKCPWWHFGLWC